MAVCEISFFLASYKLYHRLGLRRSLVAGFVFSMLGSVSLALLRDSDPEAAPVMLLLARVGIAYILNISYLGFAMLFPPIFSQTSFGFAKLLSRVGTIFSPVVAEMEAPMPMIVFTILSVVGAVSACFIVVLPEK